VPAPHQKIAQNSPPRIPVNAGPGSPSLAARCAPPAGL
jgi:hypothetical protein